MTFPALIATLAIVGLAAPAAATPPAPSGGDNPAAIRQLTDYLLYGGGTRAQRERAYVKRANAFLAVGRPADALGDARAAASLDPRDSAALAVRARAEAMIAPPMAPPPLAGAGDPSDALNAQILAKAQAVAARNRTAFATHQALQAQYEAAVATIAADTKAANDAYAASLAAHQAEVDALDKQHAADMAVWQARVEACKHGDRSQCATPPPKGS